MLIDQESMIQFMNAFWTATHIPTDIVYTGKVFFAVNTLVHQKYFLKNSKVLVIHSGGLQGNRSLTAGVLQF
jgi:1-aminocyclopropane-1-carboxylate deaminase